MAKFNTGQSFADGDQVTGAKLNNIIGLLDIYSGVIADQASIAATVSTADLLLIADTDAGSSGAANKVTIQKLLNDTLTGGTFTNANIAEQLTYGTATGNRTVSTSAVITNGTITNGVIPVGTFGTTTSTAATITSGTITTGLIPTLTAGTTTGTAGIFTSGTIATLNSTTGTVATLNSTTGTIGNLSATTSTFLGTITGSTNVVNIGSEQIYKDASGNVGIGRTPTNKLDILASTNTGITISNGTMTAIFANSSDTSIAVGTQTTHPLNFYTNNLTRMTIDSSGVFYVNETATNTASQAIISGGTANALEGETSSSASYPFLAINTATSGSNRFVYFGTEAGGSSIRGFIDYNRGSNVTRYSTTSDARLKNVIGDSSGEESVSILKNTKIRDYTWKEDQFAKVNVGVIAQELYGVFKGAVSIGNEIVRKDENGNNVIVEEPWGVDKTAFTFHLISGWQTHEKLIQELKAENNSLKSRIEALEAK